MNNGRVSEETLFKFLTELGLDSANNTEDLFKGDIKKYINELLVTRHHYLKREKSNRK